METIDFLPTKACDRCHNDFYEDAMIEDHKTGELLCSCCYSENNDLDVWYAENEE